MDDAPSIKGTAFQSVLDDVARLVESGAIDAEKLESATKPEDRELLDEQLVPGIWYPLESYTRTLDLLWEIEGKREPEYLIDRGVRAAERILAAGAYADMMDTAGRWGGKQMVQSVLNLSKSLFNFVEIEIHGELANDCFEVSFRHTASLPDCALYATQGFFRPLFGRLAGCEIDVKSRRASNREVRFSVSHA